MIDINIYRRNEELAREELPSWQIRSRHNLEIFEKVGFPTRLNNISQLRQLLDTMSEHLFDSSVYGIENVKEEIESKSNILEDNSTNDFFNISIDKAKISYDFFPNDIRCVLKEWLLNKERNNF